MTVVADSSPLIALARIGQLNLLATLFRRILIPAEVHHEVTVAGMGLPGAEQVRSAAWIEVAAQRLPADPFIERVCQTLGAQEVSSLRRGLHWYS